jgi:ribosomal protein S18 acetylase RimI-like enzyme
MQIVPYTNSDAPAVAMLFRNVFREMGWKERPSDHMDSPHLLFHLPDGGVLILAKEKDRVIGTAGLILFTKTEALIKRFYLEQEYRGTGVAQKLLQELIEYAITFGVTKLILDVRKNNFRAVGFYRKNGFQETTVTPRSDWPESNTPEIRYFLYKLIGGKI